MDINRAFLKGPISTKKRRLRVAVFVDGFNVYHFLDKTLGFNKYKWLNYKKLAECYAPHDSDIVSVHFFTAFTKWDQGKYERHDAYIRALRTKGITVVLGRFKPVEKTFIVHDPKSSQKYRTVKGVIRARKQTGYTFEEKQTDVNLGVHIVTLAALDQYDIALIVSGDTDFEPAIRALREHFPSKQVMVTVPNRHIAGSLRNLVGKVNCYQILESHLRQSQLESPIKTPTDKTLTRPTTWT